MEREYDRVSEIMLVNKCYTIVKTVKNYVTIEN